MNKHLSAMIVAVLALVCVLAVPVHGAFGAEIPKRGGILTFVVAGGAPSFDAHCEWTFAVIQRIAPFYSVLIRVNPDKPSSTTDFVCDLCITVSEWRRVHASQSCRGSAL